MDRPWAPWLWAVCGTTDGILQASLAASELEKLSGEPGSVPGSQSAPESHPEAAGRTDLHFLLAHGGCGGCWPGGPSGHQACRASTGPGPEPSLPTGVLGAGVARLSHPAHLTLPLPGRVPCRRLD